MTISMEALLKKKFGICLALLFAAAMPARAGFFYTAVIRPTNMTSSGNGVTINSSLRYGSNQLLNATWVTNASPAQSATNLFSNLSLFPLGGVNLAMTNTNSIVISGPSLTASITAGWGTLNLYTNTTTNLHALMLPYSNKPIATRTNDINDTLDGWQYATTILPPTSPALGAYVNTSTSQEGSNKTWSVGVLKGNRSTNEVGLHGTNYSLYGGLYTSPRLLSPNTTNLVNQGNAISSIGAGSSSEQFGSSATASGTSSTAIGNASIATGNFSSALGWDAEADQLNDVAIGAAANASGPNALAVGTTATAVAINGVAIGNASAANFENSAALGYGAIANASNQVMLGSSSHKVSVPGRLEGNITNSIYGGTNRWKGDISWEEGTYSSMANTNCNIPAFTNAVVYLSGSTTSHDIPGVAGGRKGLRIRFYDSGTLPLTIRNLGGGASAGNRIRTRTGNDVTLTNNPAAFELDYNSTASEWNLITLGN